MGNTSSEETKDAKADNPQEALPSSVSLADLGLTAEDLPEWDPASGKLCANGQELDSGTMVYVYGAEGEPLFGYTVGTDSLGVAVEAGALRALERPASSSAAAPQTAPVVATQDTAAKPEADAADKETAPAKPTDRRTRALERAAQRRTEGTPAARPKIRPTAQAGPRKNPFRLTAILSSIVCLVVIAWGALRPESLKNAMNVVKGQPSDSASTDTGTVIEPKPFGPEDILEGETVDVMANRLLGQGWLIVKPTKDPKWGMRSTKTIDNGEFDSSGHIKFPRKGKKAFRLVLDAGFIIEQGKTPDPEGNLYVLLGVPSAGGKLNFGFGQKIGSSFLVSELGGKRETRRHDPVKIEYKTWYQMQVKGDGKYTSFYFCGKKVDSLELSAGAVTEVGLCTFKSRACFKNFRLSEEGVAEPSTNGETAK